MILRLMLASGFYDVNLANVVTWLLIATAFVVSQYVTVKLLGARMGNFEEWKNKHELEADARERLIQKLEVNTEKLTLLAELAQERLGRLEGRGGGVFIRRDETRTDYEGPERRKKRE